MAEIVFAAGAPHAPGLIGLLEAAPADVKDIVVTTYRNLASAMVSARADVLIVFANDHLAIAVHSNGSSRGSAARTTP